jgi:hypothetical protein
MSAQVIALTAGRQRPVKPPLLNEWLATIVFTPNGVTHDWVMWQVRAVNSPT